jgi:hypothetical protein
MEQRLSEANRRYANLVKKFPAFHGTPKVHHRVHNSPTLVAILSHVNPIHTPQTLFL